MQVRSLKGTRSRGSDGVVACSDVGSDGVSILICRCTFGEGLQPPAVLLQQPMLVLRSCLHGVRHSEITQWQRFQENIIVTLFYNEILFKPHSVQAASTFPAEPKLGSS